MAAIKMIGWPTETAAQVRTCGYAPIGQRVQNGRICGDKPVPFDAFPYRSKGTGGSAALGTWVR